MPAKKKSNTKELEVNLPDAVKKQGEKADELLAGEPKEPTNPEPAEPTAEPAKPVEPTNPEPKPVEPGTMPVDDGTYEQRYKVLKGKYDKEVGDLRAGINNLNVVVQQQNALIEQLQNQTLQGPAPAQGQAAPKKATVSDIKNLDPDDFASYGDEIVWLVNGFNKLIEQNQALTERIESGSTAGGDDRIGRLESMVKESATDRYMRALDESIPNWRQVNDSAEFKSWLASIDDVTGYRYNDVMRYAANNLKHIQVIALFKRYASMKNVDLGTPRAGQPATVPGIQRDNGVVDQTVDPLASQAMYDTAAGDGGETHPNQSGKAPTREDVARASALYAKGKISIEEFNKISDRFQMAQKAQR